MLARGKRDAEICRTHCDADKFAYRTRIQSGEECARAIEEEGNDPRRSG